MIFDYMQMQELREWYGNHPTMRLIIIIGFIALLIIMSFLCKQINKWEEKIQQENRLLKK